MSVPKFRQTSSRVRRRRSHMHLTKTDLTTCTKCKKPVKPHTACMACGFYKGRTVIDMSKADEVALKASKAKTKEVAEDKASKA